MQDLTLFVSVFKICKIYIYISIILYLKQITWISKIPLILFIAILNNNNWYKLWWLWFTSYCLNSFETASIVYSFTFMLTFFDNIEKYRINYTHFNLYK